MSLFDKLLEEPEYKKLYESLPNDERPIMMDAMRKLVEQFEYSVIAPLNNIISGSSNNSSKNK